MDQSRSDPTIDEREDDRVEEDEDVDEEEDSNVVDNLLGSNQNPPSVSGGSENSDRTIPSILLKNPRVRTDEDLGEEDDEDESVFGKLSSIFRHDKINDILTYTAQVLNLEAVHEEKPSGSLFFGHLSKPGISNVPILKMPSELTSLSDKPKWRPFPTNFFNSLFKVEDSDFDEFFRVSSLDDDVGSHIKKPNKSTKLTSFDPFWEAELLSLDLHFKVIERLSAFQLTILNSLAIQLQPLDSPDSSSQFSQAQVFETTKLVTDISSQIVSASVNLSSRASVLRRMNIAEGLKGKFVDSLVKDLVGKSDYENKSLLFGGEFYSTAKSVAKSKTNEQSLQKVQTQVSQASSDTGKGGGGYYGRGRSQPSRGANRGRGRSRGGAGRGFKRDFQSSFGTETTTPPPKRGRGRGRGRGHGQSRF